MAPRSKKEYPRVLVITQHSFDLSHGGGIALTNYFSGWPVDKIAQAHLFNPRTPADTSVCQTFYHLAGGELLPTLPIRAYRALKAFLFQRPKDLERFSVESKHQEPKASTSTETQKNHSSRLYQAAAKALARHGFFSTVGSKISPEFDQFIQDFGPEVIFTIPGDLASAHLQRLVSERYGIPLVLQIPDDWMSHYPRQHLVNRLTYGSLKREMMRLLRGASLRFSISDSMNAMLANRYGVEFETLLSPVALQTWHVGSCQRDRAGGPQNILYAGTIYEVAQLQGLIDISDAVARLNAEGFDCRLIISTPQDFIDRYAARFAVPHTSMEPYRTRDDVIEAISASDLLVIPVEFDPKTGAFVRYSMPAKVVAYMASGVPMLIYGPEYVPPVQEAMRDGFAHVVMERNVDRLAGELRRALSDSDLRKQMVERATHRAREHHDIEKVADRFRAQLAAVVVRQDGSMPAANE